MESGPAATQESRSSPHRPARDGSGGGRGTEPPPAALPCPGPLWVAAAQQLGLRKAEDMNVVPTPRFWAAQTLNGSQPLLEAADAAAYPSGAQQQQQQQQREMPSQAGQDAAAQQAAAQREATGQRGGGGGGGVAHQQPLHLTPEQVEWAPAAQQLEGSQITPEQQARAARNREAALKRRAELQAQRRLQFEAGAPPAGQPQGSGQPGPQWTAEQLARAQRNREAALRRRSELQHQRQQQGGAPPAAPAAAAAAATPPSAGPSQAGSQPALQWTPEQLARAEANRQKALALRARKRPREEGGKVPRRQAAPTPARLA